MCEYHDPARLLGHAQLSIERDARIERDRDIAHANAVGARLPRGGPCTLGQQRPDLVIGGGREVLIPLADGPQVRGRLDADDLIGLLPQRRRGRRRGDWDGKDHAAGAALSQ